MYQTYRDRKKLYNSKTWKNIREIKMRDSNHECERCKSLGETTGYHTGRQLDIHHIKPLEERPDLAYELDNLMVVCKNCHNYLEGRHWKQKEKKWNDERWD